MSKHGVTVKHSNDYLHITSQPYGWMGLLAKLFMIFFSGLSWVFFFQKLIDVADAETPIAYLIPLLHLIFSCIVSYVALAYCKNRAHIYVSKDIIEVFSAPIWMPGHKRFETKKIDRIYFHHQSSYHGGVKSQLRAKLKGNNEVTLVGNVTSAAQARYIEQHIRDYLDAENQSATSD